MSDQLQWILWILVPCLFVVGLGYAYVEYQASLLRTKTTKIPSGLKFSAHGLVVEMRRNEQELFIQASNATFTQQPPEGLEQVQQGDLAVTLRAPQLRIEVARLKHKVPDQEEPQASGWCTVTFRAESEQSVLRVDHVPEKIGVGFHAFANRVRLWIDKLEHNLALQAKADAEKLAAEEAARLKAENEAQDPAESGAADPNVPPEVSVAAQIARWRAKAGWTGSSSEVNADAKGNINWFIDLDTTGRITLHAGGRTIHTTLKGAVITSLGGELEIGVRDDYWTETDPELKSFRLFKGASPDVRRAWKERLEILRESLFPVPRPK
jgi:hypothetical protein